MSAAEVKNLEAIAKAIDQHNANCEFPAVEVRMCAFEVDRLGWDTIKGLPIIPDPGLGSGRFRVVCGQEKAPKDGVELPDAVAVPAEVPAEREAVPVAVPVSGYRPYATQVLLRDTWSE